MAVATLKTGDVVRVLEPFAGAFPDPLAIAEVIVHEDGQVAYLLGEEGAAGAFDPNYVELVE